MFQIDFFELQILTEACIPPGTIARYAMLMSLIDRHWAVMTAEQRQAFYQKIRELSEYRYDLIGKPIDKDTQKVLARFDPNNQYILKSKEETLQCYKFQDEYYITSSRMLSETLYNKVKKLEAKNG